MDKASIDATMDTILDEVKNEIAEEEKKAAASLSHLSEKPITEMTAAEIKEIEEAINAAAQQDAAAHIPSGKPIFDIEKAINACARK